MTIAVHDLGGQGRPLLLAHASGFHGRVFAPLARLLGRRFSCSALDLRGHGDSTAPADGNFDWSGFGRDVLCTLDAIGAEEVIGIGHSCGGAALLLAEQARPGSFSSLYCFEPVVFPPDALELLEVGRPLAARAKQRREIFSSRREAYDNYVSKPPMSGFDPEVLEAYVRFGFEDLADGTVRLLCRPENEARVYEAGARNRAFARLGEINCPVVLGCGAESYDFTPALLSKVAAEIPEGRLEVLPGVGHFGPLERPAEVAEAMIQALDPPPA